MRLTENRIKRCKDDNELFKLLLNELERQLPNKIYKDYRTLLGHIRKLSPGLRAMAAIEPLSLSMALDDLGWHFANNHDKEYCEETLKGLKELEADEAAEIFSESLIIVQPYWEKIGCLLDPHFDKFTKWYNGSDLEKSLDPLNKRMWKLIGKLPSGTLSWFWIVYARKYPEKVVSISD